MNLKIGAAVVGIGTLWVMRALIRGLIKAIWPQYVLPMYLYRGKTPIRCLAFIAHGGGLSLRRMACSALAVVDEILATDGIQQESQNEVIRRMQGTELIQKRKFGAM